LFSISNVFMMSFNDHFRTMGGEPIWQSFYLAKMTRR
jgi:hypothetical protein